MEHFKLRKSRVTGATYEENLSAERKETFPVEIRGCVTIPKKAGTGEAVSIALAFRIGDRGERLLMTIDLLCVFEITDDSVPITDELVRNECQIVALEQMRETARDVSVAYRMQPIELPPFE